MDHSSWPVLHSKVTVRRRVRRTLAGAGLLMVATALAHWGGIPM
ncbi:hypothetical protein [Granulibacter bethesdensis]|nr:hypothetical protein [Granulibacter bethesdensis]